MLHHDWNAPFQISTRPQQIPGPRSSQTLVPDPPLCSRPDILTSANFQGYLFDSASPLSHTSGMSFDDSLQLQTLTGGDFYPRFQDTGLTMAHQASSSIYTEEMLHNLQWRYSLLAVLRSSLETDILRSALPMSGSQQVFYAPPFEVFSPESTSSTSQSTSSCPSPKVDFSREEKP